MSNLKYYKARICNVKFGGELLSLIIDALGQSTVIYDDKNICYSQLMDVLALCSAFDYILS